MALHRNLLSIRPLHTWHPCQSNTGTTFPIPGNHCALPTSPAFNFQFLFLILPLPFSYRNVSWNSPIGGINQNVLKIIKSGAFEMTHRTPLFLWPKLPCSESWCSFFPVTQKLENHSWEIRCFAFFRCSQKLSSSHFDSLALNLRLR